jgi:hypothetical protein
MRAVNLLPRDDAKRTKTNVPVLGGIVGAVVVTAVLAMMFLSASSSVRDKQTQLADLKASLAAIPPPPPPDTAGQALVGEQKLRLTALGTALTRRIAWDRVLRDLSLILPSDVWLNDLNAISPASPGSAAPAPILLPGTPPSQFTITGYTYSQAGVARLLSRLERLPELTDVQLLNSTQTKVGTQTVVQFSIAANVRTGAAT